MKFNIAKNEIKKTPMVAFEALLGLPPLHLEIKVHAKAMTLRLKTGKRKQNYHTWNDTQGD